MNWIRNWILNWIWIKNVPGYPIRWEYVWVYLVGWRVEWAGSRSGSRMVERMGLYWGWVEGDPMRFEFNQWQKNLEIPLVFLHSIGLYISWKNLKIFPISVRWVKKLWKLSKFRILKKMFLYEVIHFLYGMEVSAKCRSIFNEMGGEGEGIKNA